MPKIAPAGKGSNSRLQKGSGVSSPKKKDSEKSASKKSEVTRRKRRKAMRSDLEIQAKDLLKKY